MNSSFFKFTCVVAMILLAGCEAVILSFPRNEMGLVSKGVELQCSTNSTEPLRWHVTSAGTMTATVLLFSRGNFTSAIKLKYGIDTSIRGQFNLIIESVDFSYAGKYRCTEEPFGPGVEAELAVIDPQPLCQANASDIDNSLAENDYLWMQCSLGFSGNVNLRMDWMRNSTGNVIHSTSDQRNQSTILTQVNSSDNGEMLIFKATFTQENNSRETVISWNYTVNVLYIPRNLVINPMNNVYMVGERLECSADGNPIPTYEWTDTGTNRTINGPVLTIDEHMKSDQNHSFACRAYNTVAGLRNCISETVTFFVTGTTPRSSGSSDALTVSVVSVALICIVIVIVLLITCRANVKAWISRCSLRTAEIEPDVVHMDPMIHYYDIEEVLNDGPTELTAFTIDDNVATQAESPFSIYAVIRSEDNETMIDSLNPLQQVRAPLYSEGDKNEKRQERMNREMQTKPNQIPPYSQVKKAKRTSKTNQDDSNTNNPSSTTSTVQQMNYFGADGTEYTRVNSFEEDTPIATTPRQPLFHRVENYAFIDHTRRAPPPLPILE